jgi:hypothetical protein
MQSQRLPDIHAHHLCWRIGMRSSSGALDGLKPTASRLGFWRSSSTIDQLGAVVRIHIRRLCKVVPDICCTAVLNLGIGKNLDDLLQSGNVRDGSEQRLCGSSLFGVGRNGFKRAS